MATIDKYLKVRKGVDTPDVLTSSATVYDYLKTPLVYFDTTASALPAVGGVVWDDGEGTLSLGLKGGNVNLQIGQENIALCYNGTASAISAGNVVYISGAQGQRPSISLATSITEQGSSKVFGIVAESIASGAEGLVATFGVVPGINTEGITEGAALWLSASAGKFTETKPTSPNHLVFIGYCLKANASSGRIFVNPQNGYELEELHDVLITSASNNHIISYNSASGLWVNKNILDAVKEVDGAGSGIDADLLDGLDSTHFLSVSAASSTYIPITSSVNFVTLNGTQTLTNKTLTSPNITDGVFQDTFTIGSQIFYEQGTNGFSVNEDFDPSNSSLQTAYHYTSGAGRETVAFTLARTGQFTNGFGIYGTAASNAFVNFGEQSNTKWEWRSGVGIRPLNLSGGTLRMSLSSSGVLSLYSEIQSTSASNGAMIISGGVGINKTLNVGEKIISPSATFINKITVPTPVEDTDAATKKYVDDTIGGQAVAVSSASAYPSSATEHSLFFNTSSERMAIRVGSVWKEFSFVSDAPVGGGDSSTLVFASSIDGGDSSTTNFVNNYDGGNS